MIRMSLDEKQVKKTHSYGILAVALTILVILSLADYLMTSNILSRSLQRQRNLKIGRIERMRKILMAQEEWKAGLRGNMFRASGPGGLIILRSMALSEENVNYEIEDSKIIVNAYLSSFFGDGYQVTRRARGENFVAILVNGSNYNLAILVYYFDGKINLQETSNGLLIDDSGFEIHVYLRGG